MVVVAGLKLVRIKHKNILWYELAIRLFIDLCEGTKIPRSYVRRISNTQQEILAIRLVDEILEPLKMANNKNGNIQMVSDIRSRIVNKIFYWWYKLTS